jgi:hypothetical protein
MGALLSGMLSWLFKTLLIKFVTFTVLYLVVSSFVTYLISKLSTFGPDSLIAALSAWSPAMWYFADLTLFTQGVPAVISAYALRFAIRRMPIIG